MTKLKLSLASAAAALLTFTVAACGPQAEPPAETPMMQSGETAKAPEADPVAPVDAPLPGDGAPVADEKK